MALHAPLRLPVRSDIAMEAQAGTVTLGPASWIASSTGLRRRTGSRRRWTGNHGRQRRRGDSHSFKLEGQSGLDPGRQPGFGMSQASTGIRRLGFVAIISRNRNKLPRHY